MAKRRKKSSAGSDVVVAEFGHKDAKGGGSRNPRVPEGDYLCKILSAEKKEAKESGNQMIVWKLKIIEGKYKGKEMTARTVLIPTALFMLRHLLEALGVDVPEKTTKIKYSKYVGRKIGITVEDGEFNNKPTSDVNDFIDPDMIGADEDEDDLDDEDDDDEDDDDEESDEDGDNLDDLSRKELKEYIAEEELDVKVKKSMDEDDIREAIREADREAEGDSDEDDDEEMDEVDLDEL